MKITSKVNVKLTEKKCPNCKTVLNIKTVESIRDIRIIETCSKCVFRATHIKIKKEYS